MRTLIPTVNVQRSPNGWVINCTSCGPLRTVTMRGTADVLAIDHQNQHGHRIPIDEED